MEASYILVLGPLLWWIGYSLSKIAKLHQKQSKGNLVFDDFFTAAKAICQHEEEVGIRIAQRWVGYGRATLLSCTLKELREQGKVSGNTDPGDRVFLLLDMYVKHHPNEGRYIPVFKK